MTKHSPVNDELTQQVLKLEDLLRAQGPKSEYWEGIEVEGDSAVDVDHEIGWAEYGEYRLLYRRTKFDQDDHPVSEKTIPVSEVPAALRPLILDLLPLFMEAFAEHLEEGVGDDDEDSEEFEDEDDA